MCLLLFLDYMPARVIKLTTYMCINIFFEKKFSFLWKVKKYEDNNNTIKKKAVQCRKVKKKPKFFMKYLIKSKISD